MRHDDDYWPRLQLSQAFSIFAPPLGRLRLLLRLILAIEVCGGSTRQRDALTFTAGQKCSPFADNGVETHSIPRTMTSAPTSESASHMSFSLDWGLAHLRFRQIVS